MLMYVPYPACGRWSMQSLTELSYANPLPPLTRCSTQRRRWELENCRHGKRVVGRPAGVSVHQLPKGLLRMLRSPSLALQRYSKVNTWTQSPGMFRVDDAARPRVTVCSPGSRKGLSCSNCLARLLLGTNLNI